MIQYTERLNILYKSYTVKFLRINIILMHLMILLLSKELLKVLVNLAMCNNTRFKKKFINSHLFFMETKVKYSCTHTETVFILAGSMYLLDA